MWNLFFPDFRIMLDFWSQDPPKGEPYRSLVGAFWRSWGLLGPRWPPDLAKVSIPYLPLIVMCFVLCWCVLVRAPCCSGYAPLCLTTEAPRWRAPCSAPPMRMRRGRLILITRAPLQCPVDVRKKPDVVPVQFFYFMYLSLRGDACSDRCP